MTKHSILTALFCLALLGGASSCKKVVVNNSPIKTAVKVTASDITANAATIAFLPTTAPDASEVASYIVTGPALAAVTPYKDWTPVQSLDEITANGKVQAAPYKETFDDLMPGMEYVIGLVAKNANGEICSAPTFFKFATMDVDVDCSINCITEENPFVYEYTIVPGEYTTKVQYLVSTDPAIVKADDAKLLKTVLESTSFTTEPIKAQFTETEKKDAIIVAIAYDTKDNASIASFTSSVYSSKASAAVVVNGVTTNLSQPDEQVNYFVGEVQMPATGTFTINLSKVPFGFIPYSGNGGIGTVNNDFACVPYYNLKNVVTNFKFEVEKSIGQMMTIAEGAQPFWLNMPAACKVKVVVDQTYEDGIPRYYICAINTDPKRVFHEGFDLMVYGCFYPCYITGSCNGKFEGEVPIENVCDVDGTEPGKKDKCSVTTNGLKPFTWGGPEVEPEKDGVPTDLYIKNRDLTGWQLKRIVEAAGHVQLGNSQTSHKDAFFITPKLENLTSATDVILTTEAFRFAGDGNVNLAILNAGTITKVVVKQVSGICSSGESVGEGEFFPASNEFTITKAILPKVANASTEKPIAKITMYVSGATSDTQIKFYVPEEVTGKDGRIQFNYIDIVKQ